MSLRDCEHFLLQVELRRDKVLSFAEYPFSLPVVKTLKQFKLHPSVTFIVGENGSGKSTLLEAIAVAYGFNAEGGSRNFGFATRASHSDLHDYLRLAKGINKPSDGYFLRAESFYNVATYVDGIGVTGYGDKSLHDQSHGESFWSLFMHRFQGHGLYILDEPEAALSPARQLALLVRLHDLVREGSQFLIATHSPILMAYPNAVIHQLTENGLKPILYEETEHFTLTKSFLNNPQGMLRELFKD